MFAFIIPIIIVSLTLKADLVNKLSYVALLLIRTRLSELML